MVRIHQMIEISTEEIIEEVNKLPEADRWNFLGAIMNELDLKNIFKDPRRRGIVQRYLENQIIKLNK